MNVSITIKLLLKYYIIVLILPTLEFPNPIAPSTAVRPIPTRLGGNKVQPPGFLRRNAVSRTFRAIPYAFVGHIGCRPIRRLFTALRKNRNTPLERRIRSDPTRYDTGRNGIYRTGNRYDEAPETVPMLFTRKQRISSRYGRSSDLFRTARLPGPNGQWQRECTAQKKLTATGIVPDFHRIPF